MISKYGQRSAGPVLRQFSNNMGVVTDKEGLANLIKDLYWSPWMRMYDALNLEYNITDSNRKKITIDQTDNRDIKSENTDTETKTGNNTVTVDGTSTDTTDMARTTSGSNQQSGSDVTTVGTHESKSDTELNNLDTQYTDDDLGATHQITENTTEGTDSRTSSLKESQPPYDTDAMKDVLERNSSDNNTTTSSNKLTEKTLDKSVMTRSGENTGSSNESVTYGKKDETTGSITDKGTVSNKENTTNTETISETIKGSDNSSTTDDLMRHIVTDEIGNNGMHTSQELINQELELRRKNIYNSMISDVVNLLTLSIY